MMKMQVPAKSAPQLINGKYIDVSGLVHLKLHDNQWTRLPTPPNTDSKRRELHRPCTTATLNMAATAAQSARLWKRYDPAYSEKCLAAARTAYAAAKANPTIYASGGDWDLGGGAYSDDDATDEFFWAAANLYITTKEDQYKHDVMNSSYYLAATSTIFPQGGFSWASTASLGALSLAVVPNGIPHRQKIIQSVIDGAEQYMHVQAGQPTGVMMTTYPWGSNSTYQLSYCS